MKKILFALIGVLSFVPAYADDGSGMMMGMVTAPQLLGTAYTSVKKGCGINSINVSGFQNKDDNEYLYENSKVYEAVPDTNGTYNDLPGKVWECDNEYCTNRTVIQAPAGHYFKGVKQSKANWYKCRSDEWHPFACGESYISFDGNQKAADNEFLYANESAWLGARQASNSKQDGADLSGNVYECDNRHCLGRALKTMPAGHYFKGERINTERQYRCYTGVDDRWEPVVEASAATCGETYISFDGQGAADNEFLYSNEAAYKKAQNARSSGQDGANELGGLVYECDNDHCTNGVVKEMPAGHVFGGQVIKEKRNYLCKSNFSGDDRWVLVTSMDEGKGTTLSCPEGSSNAFITHEACLNKGTFECTKFAADGKSCLCGKCNTNKNDDDKDDGAVVGKCHPSVCTSEVCKACCAKPGSETIWTPSIPKCVCVNGGDFVKEGDEWVCKVGADEPEVDKYVCDEMLMRKLTEWKTKCASFADVLENIGSLEEYCAGAPEKEAFLRLYDELSSEVKNVCVKKEDTSGSVLKRIESSVASLKTLTSDLEVSKWKDKDGKFNTARLASDSIAGVVLGTAGGLITSSVVKKHQVKEGFEDLSCTIGGQTVAGWGDEFRVGVQ